MSGEIIGSASVRVEPDTTGFEETLTSAVQSAAAAAAEVLTSTIQSAASTASDALAGIGPDGLDPLSTAAQSAADDVSSAFTTAASNANDALAGTHDEISNLASDIPAIEIDTTPAQSALDELATTAANLDPIVNVEADTTAADAALQDVANTAAGTEADIPITADTSEADAAISSVGDAAAGSTPGVEGLTGAVESFKGSTSSATGIAAGLGSAASKLPGQFGIAAAGIGAFVEIAKGLVESGTDSIATQQRLQLVFGQTGEAIEKIKVGNLDTDIKHLADDTGSLVLPMENVLATIGQVGQGSGQTSQQIQHVGASVLALSGYAASLNPRLGDTGDVAERLTKVLESGRTRGLIPYNLGVSQAALNQQAFAQFHAASIQQLTPYQKLVVTATALTDKYGESLKNIVGHAQDNPIVQLRSLENEFKQLFEELGRPLVAPVIEILKDLEPLGIVIAKVLAQMVTALLPAGLAFAQVIQQLSPFIADILQIAGPIVALSVRFSPLVLALELTARVLQALHTPLQDFFNILEHIIGGPLQALGGIVSHLPGPFGSAGRAMKEAGKEITDGMDSSATAADGFSNVLDDQTGLLNDATGAADTHSLALDALNASYQPLIASATQGADAVAAVRNESSTAGDALDTLAADGLNPTNDELVSFAINLNNASLSSAGLDNAAIALGITTAQLTGYLQAVNSAISSFVSKSVSGLPSVADAAKATASSAAGAGKAVQNTAEQALQAQRSIENAQHGVETANRAVADSNEQLTKANQNVEKSVQSLTEAQKNLADAEGALALARSGASADTVEQANINLERSQLNQQKATEAVAQAEQDLDDARNGKGSKTVQQAEEDLQSARLDARDSVLRVHDAEQQLNQVRLTGTEQDPAVIAAEKGVTDARNGVADATQKVIDSQEAVAKAHQGVADAAFAAKQAEEELQITLAKPPPSGGGGGAGGAAKAQQASLQEFIANLKKSTIETATFLTNLSTIFDHGGKQLAVELAQLGAQTGGKYAAELAASIGKDGKSALVSSAEGAVEGFQSEMNTAPVFLRTKFGPTFAASNAEVAEAGKKAFGDHFNLGAAVTIQAEVAAGDLNAAAGQIAIVAASKGTEAAEAYAKANNIDQKSVEAGLAAAAKLQNIDLSTPAGHAASTAVLGFHTVLDDPTTGLPGVTQRALTDVHGTFDHHHPVLQGLGSNAADGVVTGYHGKIGLLGDETTKGIDAAGVAVDKGKPGLNAKGAGAGDESGNALGRQFGQAVTVAIGKGMQDQGAHDAINSAASNVVNYTDRKLSENADGAGRQAGEFITAGLAKGMQDGPSHTAIDDAAQHLVHYAESRINFHAQTSSPSKLFAAASRFWGLGLAQGLRDTAQDVADAATDSVQVAFNAVNAARQPIGSSISPIVAQAEQIVRHAFESTETTSLGGLGGTGGLGTGSGSSTVINVGGVQFALTLPAGISPAAARELRNAVEEGAGDTFLETIRLKTGARVQLQRAGVR